MVDIREEQPGDLTTIRELTDLRSGKTKRAISSTP